MTCWAVKNKITGEYLVLRRLSETSRLQNGLSKKTARLFTMRHHADLCVQTIKDYNNLVVVKVKLTEVESE